MRIELAPGVKSMTQNTIYGKLTLTAGIPRDVPNAIGAALIAQRIAVRVDVPWIQNNQVIVVDNPVGPPVGKPTERKK